MQLIWLEVHVFISSYTIYVVLIIAFIAACLTILVYDHVLCLDAEVKQLL